MSSEFEIAQSAPATIRETRPLYWSIRRELWENRFVSIAPLVIAAVVLFAMLMSTITLPRRMRAADNPVEYAAVVQPFKMAPAPIMLASFLLGMFYALDALYGERRERSLLFWKSLPVSDRTTVLSKAAIPLVVLPLYAFILSVIATVVIFAAGTLVLLGSGTNAIVWLREFGIFEEPVVMLYGLTVHALWFAPIYGWLLLVSAWARRLPIVWAVLPLFLIGAFERVAFNSTRFAQFLRYRFMGAMDAAFTYDPNCPGVIDNLSQLSPGRFLATPGLWAGLLFTAGCLIAAVRLRRSRDPV